MTFRYHTLLLLFLTTLGKSWGAIEVMPMVGYHFTPGFAVAGPQYNRLDIRDKPLIGLALGYINEENGQLEISWTHSNTSAQIDKANGSTDSFDIDMDRIHLHGIFVGPGKVFFPFGLVGIGATRFNPSNHRNSTLRLSFALGGGMKWRWNDYLGMRFDARWVPTLAPKGAHFFCENSSAGECYSRDPHSMLGRAYPFLNSMEFTTGLIFRY